MSIVNLITVIEADDFNKLSEDWLNLDYLEKDNHILNATIHIYSKWNCINYDLTDVDNLESDIKRACAMYAEADRLGYLNPSLDSTEDKGSLIKQKSKVGSLEEELEWSKTTKRNKLLSIDKLLSLYCESTGTNVVRV